MGLSLRNITKKIGDVASGVERQVNPFDNGQTYQQKTPTGNSSVVGQIANSGAAHVVQGAVVRPAVSLGKSVYDIGRGAAADFTNNPVALANANRAKAIDEKPALDVIHGVTRTVPEVATSLVNHNVYHPGSQIEQDLFGSTPVKSVQKKVVDTYHDKGIGMAALELVGSLAQDAPVIGAGTKVATTAVKTGVKAGKVVKDASIPLNEIGAVGKDVNNIPKGPPKDSAGDPVAYQKTGHGHSVIGSVGINPNTGESVRISLGSVIKTPRGWFTTGDVGTKFSTRDAAAQHLLDMKAAKEAAPVTPQAPVRTVYGKKVEMSDVNGYKAVPTADGGTIYQKVNKWGTNAKGTQLTTDWYDVNGLKMTRPQAEATVNGQLASSKPKVTAKPVTTVPQAPPVGRTIPAPTVTSRPRVSARSEVVRPAPRTPEAPVRGDVVSNPTSVPMRNEGGLRDQLGTALIDKDAVGINTLKNIEKVSGDTGHVKKFLYNTNMLQQAPGIAEHNFRNSDAIKGAIGGLSHEDYNNFVDYANARAELRNYKGMKTFRTPEENRAIVKQFHGQFDKNYKSLNQYYKDLASQAHKEGILDDATFKRYQKNNDYIHVARDMGDLQTVTGQGKSYGLRKTVLKQRRKGSNRELLDPVHAALDFTNKTEVEKWKNRTAAHLATTLEKHGQATRVSSKQATHENVINFKAGGKQYFYKVSPGIKKLTQNMSPFQLNTLEKVVGFPARVLRAGATALNPVFTGANYIKDQVGSAVISSKTMATHTPTNIGVGLKESSKAFVGGKGSPLWQEYIKSGGDRTQYDLTRNVKGTKELVDLARGGNKAAAAHAFTHPIRTLENANSITEKATRFQNFKGIYEYSIKNGATHEQAVQDATMAALEHSVNFSRAGSWGRVVNLLVPYSNAAIQGGRTLANAAKARPFMTATKGFAWVGTPIAAATLWNTSTPENKKIYENISEYEKQNNIVLIKPGQKYKDVKGGNYDVIKIPLPPDVGTIFNSIRRGIEDHKKVAGREGVNASTVAQDLTKPFTGPVDLTNGVHGAVGSVIPQGAKPLVTIGLNRDLYTGKEVVPGYLKDSQSDPQNQVNTHTSSIARDVTGAIKKVTGRSYSPMVVDKFASDAAGKLGTIGVNAVDNVLAKTGKARVDAKGKPIVGGTSIKTAFTQRFERAVAKMDPNNDTAKYYKAVSDQYSKLNKNERAAYDTIHTTKVDGSQPDKTLYDASVRAGIYSKYPKVLSADNAVNKDSKDPFYHLPSSQQKVIITLDSLSNDPGTGAAKAIQQENPWLQDYYKQRGKFFDDLAAQGKVKTASGDKVPQAPKVDSGLQGKLDAYTGLSDSTQKHEYLTSNPEVSDYFAATDAYQRQKRSILGLPQFDKYPTASPDLQKKLDLYNSLPKHDGKKGGNATRSAFLKANPQIGSYFDSIGQWSANNDAQVAVFENHDNKTSSSGGGGGSSSGFSSFGPSQGSIGTRYLNNYRYAVKSYGANGSSQKSAKVTAHVGKAKVASKPKSGNRITMKVTKSKV